MKNNSTTCKQLLCNLIFYESKLKHHIIHRKSLEKLRKPSNNTVFGQNFATAIIIVVTIPDNGEGANIQDWKMTLKYNK